MAARRKRTRAGMRHSLLGGERDGIWARRYKCSWRNCLRRGIQNEWNASAHSQGGSWAGTGVRVVMQHKELLRCRPHEPENGGQNTR